jgi:phosphatidylglycerophosphate synthase
MLSARFRPRLDPLVLPLARRISRTGLTPNHLTLLGLLSSLLAAFAFATARLEGALLFLAFAGLSDLLDGAVARAQGIASPRGAYLDSLTDRYSDGVLFLGLLLYLDRYAFLLFLALLGSLLVSYSRARAEVLIPLCSVGIAERGERLLLLLLATLGELFAPALDPFFWALLLLAVLTHLTALQRARYALARL